MVEFGLDICNLNLFGNYWILFITHKTAHAQISSSVHFFVAFTCSDDIFGAGNVGDVQTSGCGENMDGYKVATCTTSGVWITIQNNCVLRVFIDLKQQL